MKANVRDHFAAAGAGSSFFFFLILALAYDDGAFALAFDQHHDADWMIKFHSMLSSERFIAVVGLKSRADLNGAVGRVVVPREADLVKLCESGRIKVALCRGGEFSVKPANIVMDARDSEWYAGSNPMSIFENIRHGTIDSSDGHDVNTSLGDTTGCDDLCRKIWGTMAETPPATSLSRDWAVYRDEILHQTGHKLYWIALDMIGHHFLIESVDSRFRLHQSYVVDGIPGGGFTARQWTLAAETLSPSLLLHGSKAHARWGGGRTFGRQACEVILDIVSAMMTTCDEIVAKTLLPQVPGWSAASDPTSRIAIRWAQRIIDRVGEGITMWWHGDDKLITIGKGAERETLLTIDGITFEKLNNLIEALTGQEASAGAFLKMVNHSQWRTGISYYGDFDDKTPHLEWGGFTIRALDLGMTHTPEQGVADVEQLRREHAAELGYVGGSAK